MLEFLTGYLSGNDDSYFPMGLDFHAPFPFAVCLGVLLLAGLGVGWFYAQQLQKLSYRMKWLLISLRVIAVLILTGLILDPVILIRQLSPGNQVVALIFDDSMSMRIGAGGDQSRAETLLERYSVVGEKFEAILSQQHGIQRYRIGKQAVPMSNINELRFEERNSHLLDAIVLTGGC